MRPDLDTPRPRAHGVFAAIVLAGVALAGHVTWSASTSGARFVTGGALPGSERASRSAEAHARHAGTQATVKAIIPPRRPLAASSLDVLSAAEQESIRDAAARSGDDYRRMLTEAAARRVWDSAAWGIASRFPESFVDAPWHGAESTRTMILARSADAHRIADAFPVARVGVVDAMSARDRRRLATLIRTEDGPFAEVCRVDTAPASRTIHIVVAEDGAQDVQETARALVADLVNQHAVLLPSVDDSVTVTAATVAGGCAASDDV